METPILLSPPLRINTVTCWRSMPFCALPGALTSPSSEELGFETRRATEEQPPGAGRLCLRVLAASGSIWLNLGAFSRVSWQEEPGYLGSIFGAHVLDSRLHVRLHHLRAYRNTSKLRVRAMNKTASSPTISEIRFLLVAVPLHPCGERAHRKGSRDT